MPFATRGLLEKRFIGGIRQIPPVFSAPGLAKTTLPSILIASRRTKDGAAAPPQEPDASGLADANLGLLRCPVEREIKKIKQSLRINGGRLLLTSW